LDTNTLRRLFLEFFRDRDHVVERSDSLVPDDPTLLFSSAGMVQFKPYWTGAVPLPYTRAATCQKCFRVNDIEEVGRTSRHLTFFEMLGNFSFGDYFKKEATAWAWQFVTDVLGLPQDALWISVFRDDDEAFDAWHKGVGFPAERIVRLDEKDNFWGPAGTTGACGPCSEIHLDRGAEHGCGRPECMPGCDCDRFVELYNLVFPQFDQQADGSRKPLKNRGIDTGMGLERTAVVLQGGSTVFDGDLFGPIIEASVSLAGKQYAGYETHHNVISDHARAVAFLTADGVLPSNEGRGYVLRRVLRRAARHGHDLGVTEPFLYKVADKVVDVMGETYPELVQARVQIEQIVRREEERFHSTLEHGMVLLEELFGALQTRGDTQVSGKDLFRLYDTYGFPVEIAEEVAAERGYSVDRPGFEVEMEQQRARARMSWAGSGEGGVQEKYLALRDAVHATRFIGYEQIAGKARVVAIADVGTDVLETGSSGEVILDITPFYGEAGGQLGDTGRFKGERLDVLVTNTTRPVPDLFVHHVEVKKGRLRVGDEVDAQVDGDHRREVACHHTATHILHSVLREVLGEHVHQSGSLVAPDRLRFDFTHFEAVPPETLAEIEQAVNARIRADTATSTRITDIDEARKQGAMALFGEKYGDSVRMVSVGEYSLELCGGTHVARTSIIGGFKILSESSAAAGIRRIEAVCGAAFLDYVARRDAIMRGMAAALGTTVEDLARRTESLLQENRDLAKQLGRVRQSLATGATDRLLDNVVTVAGTKLLAAQVSDVTRQELGSMADGFRERLGSGVVVLGTVENGKVALVVAVTADLADRVHAGNLIKQVAAVVGGSGGGRPDFAQAGGKNPGKLAEAVEQVPHMLKTLLGKGGDSA